MQVDRIYTPNLRGAKQPHSFPGFPPLFLGFGRRGRTAARKFSSWAFGVGGNFQAQGATQTCSRHGFQRRGPHATVRKTQSLARALPFWLMLQKPVFALLGCQRMSVNTLLCDTLGLGNSALLRASSPAATTTCEQMNLVCELSTSPPFLF